MKTLTGTLNKSQDEPIKSEETNNKRLTYYSHIPALNRLSGLNYIKNEDAVKVFKEILADIDSSRSNNERIFYLNGSKESGRQSLFESLSKCLENNKCLYIEESSTKNDIQQIVENISKNTFINLKTNPDLISGEVVKYSKESIVLKTKEMVSEFGISEDIYEVMKSKSIRKHDIISIDQVSNSIKIYGTTNPESVEVGKNMISSNKYNLISLYDFNKIYYKRTTCFYYINHHLKEIIEKGSAEIISPLILVAEGVDLEIIEVLRSMCLNKFSPYLFIKCSKSSIDDFKIVEFVEQVEDDKLRIAELALKKRNVTDADCERIIDKINKDGISLKSVMELIDECCGIVDSGRKRMKLN